jgi:high-affinity nickel-transport protein
MAVAVGASLLASQWAVPSWFELTGAWISIGVLLGLGLLNLYAVLSAAPEQVVALRGIKGRWLGRLTRAEHPLLIAGIGMLFALSFDTLSLALLFGAHGDRPCRRHARSPAAGRPCSRWACWWPTAPTACGSRA